MAVRDDPLRAELRDEVVLTDILGATAGLLAAKTAVQSRARGFTR